MLRESGESGGGGRRGAAPTRVFSVHAAISDSSGNNLSQMLRFAAETDLPRTTFYLAKNSDRPAPITREERRVARRTHVGFAGTAPPCPRARPAWLRNAAPRVTRGEQTDEFTQRLRSRVRISTVLNRGRVVPMSQATMEDEDTAMDTHDLKLSIPETSADGARSGSPESGVSTPRYSEHQSGSKRLRTKDGWEEVEGGSDPETGGPNRDDEPGTSAGMLNVTPVEVGQLVLRTKAVCSELADVIVRLARERYAHEPPPRLTILNRAFPLGRGRLKISSDLAPSLAFFRADRARR